MRPGTALLAAVLAWPSSAAAQEGAAPVTPPASTAAPAPPSTPSTTGPADVERIRRRLQTETPLLDAALTRPTFRASVTERADRFDIWSFWGEPDEVAASVRPRGGPWHHEFQDMVTPDAFKGYGGILGNGERLQLAATSLAFAGAMKLLGLGVQQAKAAIHDRSVRKAKEEVARELEAFYARHPEARPAAPATPP